MWEGVQEWVEEGLRESTRPAAIFALIISAVIGGLATLRARVWAGVRKRTLGRRLMSLHDDDPVTVVFPVSHSGKGGLNETNPERDLINRGSLDTLVTLTRFTTRLRYKNDLRVAAGEVGVIKNDLLLVGGDIRNKTSKYVIQKFNDEHRDMRIEREDAGDHREIRIGEGEDQKTFIVELPDTDPASDEKPTFDKDLVVVLAWKNPYLGNEPPRRAMIFAGFTGVGNNAGARYLTEDLAQGRASYARRSRKHGLPSLSSSQWPHFLAVLEVELHGQEAGDIKELHFAAIANRSHPGGAQ